MPDILCQNTDHCLQIIFVRYSQFGFIAAEAAVQEEALQACCRKRSL